MSRLRRQRDATAAFLAAVAAGATDAGYLTLIHAQNATPPNPGVVPFVTAYIATVAIAALLAVMLIRSGNRNAAEAVLVGATVGSAALGFVALFGIGLALLITAGLLATAARGVAVRHESLTSWVPPALGALLALGVLIAGFAFSGVFWGH